MNPARPLFAQTTVKSAETREKWKTKTTSLESLRFLRCTHRTHKNDKYKRKNRSPIGRYERWHARHGSCLVLPPSIKEKGRRARQWYHRIIISRAAANWTTRRSWEFSPAGRPRRPIGYDRGSRAADCISGNSGCAHQKMSQRGAALYKS